jgi:hypothetical protein
MRARLPCWLSHAGSPAILAKPCTAHPNTVLNCLPTLRFGQAAAAQRFPGSEWERLKCVDRQSNEESLQSFWELYDPDPDTGGSPEADMTAGFEARAAEAPSLPKRTEAALLKAVRAVRANKAYNAFDMTPGEF